MTITQFDKKYETYKLDISIYIRIYHISDMIPVALPQHRAGAGLTRSLFPVPRTQTVQ